MLGTGRQLRLLDPTEVFTGLSLVPARLKKTAARMHAVLNHQHSHANCRCPKGKATGSLIKGTPSPV